MLILGYCLVGTFLLVVASLLLVPIEVALASALRYPSWLRGFPVASGAIDVPSLGVLRVGEKERIGDAILLRSSRDKFRFLFHPERFSFKTPLIIHGKAVLLSQPVEKPFRYSGETLVAFPLFTIFLFLFGLILSITMKIGNDNIGIFFFAGCSMVTSLLLGVFYSIEINRFKRAIHSLKELPAPRSLADNSD